MRIGTFVLINIMSLTLGLGCAIDANVSNMADDIDNSVTPTPTPAPTPGTPFAIADEMSTCILQDGGLKCFGENAHYQKLDGTTTNIAVPTALPGFSSGVTSFAHGFNFSCAVLNGGVKCWGVNDFGQLGDGTTTTRTSPVDVVGLTSGVTKIVAGWRHACALLNDGGVKCWGENNAGELGRGFVDTPSGYRSTADYVSGLTTGVTDLFGGSARAEHTCAMIGDTAHCWGYNAWGQLGDNSTTSRSVPTAVSGLGTAGARVQKIIPSRYFTCALLTGNLLKCWGFNGHGHLGNNNLGTNSLIPVNVDTTNLAVGEKVVDAGLGEDHGCLLTDLGAVYCWGRDTYGKLGAGTELTTNYPRPMPSLLTSGISQLAVGRYHNCAFATDRKLYCFGAGNFGQSGHASFTNISTPFEVAY